jgi:hypothetical protein
LDIIFRQINLKRKKMKKYTQTLLILAVAVFVTAVGCKKEGQREGDRDVNAASAAFLLPTASIPTKANGTIARNLTLSNDTIWKIDGIIYLDSAAVLTIEAGTTLISGAFKTYTDQNGATRQIRGVLAVTKGTKLNAVGTASAPIVFTSPNDPCNRVPGDFGGIILLGNAPTNRTTPPVIEGLPANPPVDITYGGTATADNSGRLEYVRVEYPGFRLFADNEINGITFGGVGSGTVVNHVQVSYSNDDSFEFFGGTVNASYLLALAGDDDDFDFDFGYTGSISNAIGLKDINSTHSVSSGVSDANGIESDNDAAGSASTPLTRPVLTNFTIWGYADNSQAAELRSGNRWRRNTRLVVANSVVAGFPTGASFEGGTESGTGSSINGSIYHAFTTVFNPATVSWTRNATALLGTTSNANIRLGYNASTTDSTLNPAYVGTTSCGTVAYSFNNLLPRPGSAVASTVGAVRTNNLAQWTTGTWANFNPQTTVY